MPGGTSSSFSQEVKVALFFHLIFGCAGSLLLCRLFSSCGERGLLSSSGRQASHRGGCSCCRARARACGPQELQHMGSVFAAPRLESTGSTVVAHGLSCNEAYRIFPDQGSNLCLLHWQMDSLPLSHQGSPTSTSVLAKNSYEYIVQL